MARSCQGRSSSENKTKLSHVICFLPIILSLLLDSLVCYKKWNTNESNDNNRGDYRKPICCIRLLTQKLPASVMFYLPYSLPLNSPDPILCALAHGRDQTQIFCRVQGHKILGRKKGPKALFRTGFCLHSIQCTFAISATSQSAQSATNWPRHLLPSCC